MIMALVLVLVLVFGAFILPARRCRQLGWLSVAMLAIVMCSSIARDPVLFEPRIEVFNFLLSALVFPVFGSLAGQLSSRHRNSSSAKRWKTSAGWRLLMN